MLTLAVALLLAALSCDPGSGPPALNIQPDEPEPEDVSGSMVVSDQSTAGEAVVVGHVTISGDAGIVTIRPDAGGEPAEDVIGWRPVPKGSSYNVRIELDGPQDTGTYWAVLHQDAGTEGQFEPEVDEPVRTRRELAEEEVETVRPRDLVVSESFRLTVDPQASPVPTGDTPAASPQRPETAPGEQGPQPPIGD